MFLGLALGSFPYLLAALFLAGVALSARQLVAPNIVATRAVSALDVRTGEPVDIVVSISNEGPPIGAAVHDRAPDPFVLATGANVAADWLPTGGTAEIRYTLRAPRRGVHTFPRVKITAHDPLFLQAAWTVESGEPTEVTVHPQAPPAPRVRAPSAWGRTHLPGGDRADRGVLTNDFRELRPYQRGDPLRQVNWKATARQSRGDDLILVVNDYEVEGKKAVWLFVDASPYTVGGTNLDSAFDELATGALAVAGHYLDQSHRVGMAVYGSGAPRVLYPDAGELQERRLQAALAAVRLGDPGGGLAQAVEASKGFLARERPLLYVFTLAGRDPGLAAAVVTARALASTGRRPAPVVAVTPAFESDGSVASRVISIHEKAQLKGLERRGVTVIRYEPKRTPLPALLARGLLR